MPWHGVGRNGSWPSLQSSPPNDSRQCISTSMEPLWVNRSPDQNGDRTAAAGLSRCGGLLENCSMEIGVGEGEI